MILDGAVEIVKGVHNATGGLRCGTVDDALGIEECLETGKGSLWVEGCSNCTQGSHNVRVKFADLQDNRVRDGVRVRMTYSVA